MGSSSTSKIIFLLLFMSFYVISLSTYTYVSSLSNVNLEEIQNENKLRSKRIAGNYDEAADYWTRNISLHKCCAFNQYLNKKYQCQDGDELIPPYTLMNKLTNFVIDEKFNKTVINLSRVAFKNTNYILNLRDENAFAVNWSSPVLEDFAFSQEDLSLVLLSENTTKIISKFSTSTYCLDFLTSEQILAAFINPCSEKLCLQKCCPDEYYYNIIQNKCMKDKNIPKYVPSFYIGEIKIDVELPYYLLTGKLKCVAPYIINKLQVNNITSAIFIQDDGTLQVKNRDNNRLYRREEYCTDTFSDGFIENTYVGGLSCPSIEIMHDIVEEHEHEHRHHQEKKKNSIKMQSKSEESDSSASKIFFFEIAGIGFAIILFLY